MPTAKKKPGRKPPAKKQPLQISIDKSVLREIDADPERKRLGSRSAFITQAVLVYLRARRDKDISDRIDRAYTPQAVEEVFADLQPFLAEQVWSDDPAEVPDVLPAQPARRAPARTVAR